MIQAIVEGHGEVQAFPALLRRLIPELGCHVLVSTPIRRTRHELVHEQGFKAMLEYVRDSPQVTAALILFDADDDCAREHIPNMRLWLEEAHLDIPSAVVMARREYEAWFLGALESLRGKRNLSPDAIYLANPEEKRGAKEVLKSFMPQTEPYNPILHQAALSATFSLEQAYRRCSSFRKLVKELCRLLGALGQQPVIPLHWSLP